jgi:hypothetical protein
MSLTRRLSADEVLYIAPPSGYPTSEVFGRQRAGRRFADYFTARAETPQNCASDRFEVVEPNSKSKGGAG